MQSTMQSTACNVCRWGWVRDGF
eukprot:SAG22_NODE_19162_length_277_cov_1.078652_1_plen_22_part_01